MAMPRTLTLVRHGESEANVVQKLFKTDADAVAPEGFSQRHDTHMRLSRRRGVGQARAAGQWLLANHPEGFDKYYVSPLVRTRETAGAMAINGAWRIDDRWRERDWGEYSALNQAEQLERYPLSVKLKAQHKWYWCPPGGESLATGVRLRFEDILDTLHREAAGRQVIAVTHGEMIAVARYVLERMDPDQWLANDADPARKISNCQIIEYSRQEPGDESGDLAPQLRWMRSVCPWSQSRSWEGGEWVEIPRRPTYSDHDLLRGVEAYPPIFPEA